ncbi:hypothetical protein FZEAL_3746 [Fusarium zealandicum]|uniref:Uncharacterized protein n=1 Tax=Fusarium zealandicum TaxID=1053134 RepID=A0A8H4UNZ1_9HYPO|nr:hypothetical protein FZEAL_3746 [Fusarium zealandicum]
MDEVLQLQGTSLDPVSNLNFFFLSIEASPSPDDAGDGVGVGLALQGPAVGAGCWHRHCWVSSVGSWQLAAGTVAKLYGAGPSSITAVFSNLGFSVAFDMTTASTVGRPSGRAMDRRGGDSILIMGRRPLCASTEDMARLRHDGKVATAAGSAPAETPDSC